MTLSVCQAIMQDGRAGDKAMNERTLIAGAAWRIAPSGTTLVYLNRVLADGSALVSSKVGDGWARRPMRVSAADVFLIREVARQEYRRRLAAALAANPDASRNVTTPMVDG